MTNFHIVLYPRLPTDFLGPTVGSFEDSLLSLFTCATQIVKDGTKCIILLDGLDQILHDGDSRDGPTNALKVNAKGESSSCSNVILRVRSMFLNIVDRMKLVHSNQYSTSGASRIMTNLLVIGTTRSSHNDGCFNRFDREFHLGDPDWDERYQIIKDCLGLSSISESKDEKVNAMLSAATTSVMGKSRGEIAMSCRDVVYQISHEIDKVVFNDEEISTTATSITSEEIMRLECLHTSLQNVTPESLKQLSGDESIEMRVLSSNELQSFITTNNDDGNGSFPLLGQNAHDAWRQLQNTIIAPLCQWQELNQILYDQVEKKSMISAKKGITCGVLLTGLPSVGKTVLAYHCAAIASKMEPTLRLLDVSCNSLISKEVGGSEKNISKLFKTAQSASPCIILLDGLENIAPVRGNDNTTEGTMDRLLSTLLTEMDGVTMNNESNDMSSNKRIGVIGITHNPASWIDPAMLRPGRLEKCINLCYPDSKGRKEIAKRELHNFGIDFTAAGYFDPKDENELSEYLAMKTNSAADIIAISKNARMLAIRNALENGSEDLLLRVDHFVQAARNPN